MVRMSSVSVPDPGGKNRLGARIIAAPTATRAAATSAKIRVDTWGLSRITARPYSRCIRAPRACLAFAGVELLGNAAGETENPEKVIPKAINTVIFRIAVFYVGSVLLLCLLLPYTAYQAGVSPFVTFFGSIGWDGIDAIMNMVVLTAALSSLNAGLYSTGRVLRSLGFAKQAPRFTLLMSGSGVPWAGIVMTSVMFVLGAILNALTPDAFEIAIETTAICILYTWATIFLCQLRLRRLTDRGVIPASSFQAPGSPWTSYTGLVFLVLVLIGIAVAGWQSSPYFWHKTGFVVVVVGIPVLVAVLEIGWLIVKPKVVEHTGGRLESVWTDTGPRYGSTPTITEEGN